jgi:hypothetical protein
MMDLEFLDLPLVPKRIKNSKNGKANLLTLSKCSSINSSYALSGADEERRRRKNKDQVKILQNEYKKNPAWTRAYMKDLAKKTGLKPSQVYKWNWDQKKKEAESEKVKRLCYPNEIFKVLDSQGNNIAKPVVHKFIIDK